MKHLVSLTLLFAVMSLIAQVPTVEPLPPTHPGQFSYVVQTRPQLIPTGQMTDVIKQSAYLCYADVNASNVVVTIQDRQPTPVVLANTAVTGTWVFISHTDSNCRYFPNGLSWQAASTATGYLILKCSVPCVLSSGL